MVVVYTKILHRILDVEAASSCVGMNLLSGDCALLKAILRMIEFPNLGDITLTSPFTSSLLRLLFVQIRIDENVRFNSSCELIHKQFSTHTKYHRSTSL
jgi:hypothetical protein